MDDKIMSQYSIFFEALRIIKDNYLEPTDDERLIRGAIKGMIESLGDEHSFYTPCTDKMLPGVPEHNENNAGIGISLLKIDSNSLFVAEVFDDSSAKESGICRFDTIFSIDDKTVESMGYGASVKALRGLQGSIVNIGISKGDEVKVHKVVRKKIAKQRVFSSVLSQSNLGLARIIDFVEDGADMLYSSVKKLVKQGVKGLIIDLRNNIGGYTHNLAKCLNLFMPEGLMFVSKGNDAREVEYYRADSNFFDIDIVILVNRFTASSAEIFARLLAGAGRATIIGEPTTGKATGQELFHLSDNTSINLSVSGTFCPNGVNLHKKIMPDILMDCEPCILSGRYAYYALSIEKDPYIAKSLDCLG